MERTSDMPALPLGIQSPSDLEGIWVDLGNDM